MGKFKKGSPSGKATVYNENSRFKRENEQVARRNKETVSSVVPRLFVRFLPDSCHQVACLEHYKVMPFLIPPSQPSPPSSIPSFPSLPQSLCMHSGHRYVGNCTPKNHFNACSKSTVLLFTSTVCCLLPRNKARVCGRRRRSSAVQRPCRGCRGWRGQHHHSGLRQP